MSRISYLNILTLVLPVVCVGFLVWVVIYEVRRMNQLNEDLVRTEKQIAFVEDMRNKLAQQPATPRFPTAESTPREQIDFLTTMRLFAEANHVSLAKYSGAALVPAGTAPGAGPARPAGVTGIPSAMQITGNYASVRDFLYSILRSPRLFSMTDVRWQRGQTWPSTTIAFTLIRYVTPPGTGGPSPAIILPRPTGLQTYPNPTSPLPPAGQYAPSGQTRP